MKKAIFFFRSPFITLNGFCDIIDYWHVYYNDPTTGEYNYFSPGKSISIDPGKIMQLDVITIRHWDDTPCYDCAYYLFVRDERKRKLRITKTKEFGGKLTLSLVDSINTGFCAIGIAWGQSRFLWHGHPYGAVYTSR